MSTETDSKRTDVGYNPVPIPKGNAQEALPRVSTARVPLLNTVPQEINVYSKRNVGKSLDDTKHITVQRFAHGKILDIGAEIHNLTRQAAYRETEKAVVEAENRVWNEAELIRIRAIEELQSKLNAQHEEVMKRVRKEHEKVLKEEALRVETALRQLSLDQVKKEREEGQKQSKLAVKMTEEKCAREKEEAVINARIQEQEKAQCALDKCDESWQIRYDATVEEMEHDKKKEMDRLAEKLDWEKQRAVLQTRQLEREIAAQDLRKATQDFESRIEKLNQQIRELQKQNHNLSVDKKKVDSHLKAVGNELFVTRDTFNGYIHQVSRCDPGQADYQMPKTKFKRKDYCD